MLPGIFWLYRKRDILNLTHFCVLTARQCSNDLKPHSFLRENMARQYTSWNVLALSKERRGVALSVEEDLLPHLFEGTPTVLANKIRSFLRWAAMSGYREC